MKPLWAWYLATQWRTGAFVTVVSTVGGYYFARRGLDYEPKTAAPIACGVGFAAFTGFSVFRARIRPKVLSQGAEVHKGRPAILRLRTFTGWFLSKEWQEAITAVSDLHDHVELARFQRVGDLDMKPHLGVLGLLAAGERLLKESRAPIRVSDEEQPSVEGQPDADTVELHLRVANAAYGAVFLGAMSLIPPINAATLVTNPKTSNEADRLAFCQYVGRDRKELEFLHVSSYSERLYGPKVYLVADHRSKRLILSLRGTSSISDVFTDLACELAYVDVPDVHGPGEHIPTHNGMMRGAQNVIGEVCESMQQSAERFPDYKISVCGHSLGAGCALLCTLELALKKHMPRHIECFAFGAPPVLALPPSDQSKLFEESGLLQRAKIYNFVNGPDIIPRLSLWSANRLVHKLERIELAVQAGKISRWSKWRALRYGAKGLQEKEKSALLEAIDLDLHHKINSLCEEAWDGHCIRMFHLGSMFYLRPGRMLDAASEEHPIDADIIVDGYATFLHAHMPSQYHAKYMADLSQKEDDPTRHK